MSKIYTTKEAAAVLGLSDSRIRQLALAGKIEHQHFGKSVLITEEGINQARAREDNRGKKSTKERKAA